MDRALKERIIGAVVLVVIAVLVVPVFLDGPVQDAEMITAPVTLPGQDGAPDDRRTVVLRLDRDEPLPVPSPPAEARPAAARSAAADETPAPVVAANREEPAASERRPEPEPEPEPRQEPEPGPEPEPPAREQSSPPARTAAADSESATGMWAVQIGSFSNKANADRLAAGLREKGYAAFLSQVKTDNGGELHRVRIGPQKDRASAEAVASKLEADNVDGRVVPHP